MSDMRKESENASVCAGQKTGLLDQIKQRLAGRTRGFAREENGTMIIFGLTIFMMTLIATGMAIDFMRHENMRTRLQATLDRAVLAAADLDQTNDPQEVVEDYFAKSGLNNYNLDVDVQEGLNYRTVTANATSTVNSMFLNMVGIESIDAPAGGAAEERINNVEISLVLDISGSMDDNDKIENMQRAADEFVDTLITPDTKDLVSISVIPYTGQTNAGETLFNALNVDQKHDYSYCVEFDASDFNSVALSFTKQYEQAQHYEYSSSYYGSSYNYKIQDPWCSDKETEEIKAFQNNNASLKNVIDSYRPRTATGIHYAMKWGAALLDPSMRPIVSSMIAAGDVDPVFEGRPADYMTDANDTGPASETVKVIVLMTDGMNVDQYRIRDWAYNSTSEYKHWAKYTLWYYLYNYVYRNSRGDYYYKKYYSGIADDRLAAVCQASRNAGIVIFTIGFEINDNPYSKGVMNNCATSDSHFFAVEGVEISDAFGAIARTINQLRLIQ
ncbi:Flp pilus assembly protein TadG [Litoreibacter halocynthiae]|uniref:Flp pilus assembly protein TadG n=1 Tax=Litoreibacter halocynthiae TaxID=1242689 RepID=A0A4R7LKA2_9RHOB|nr:TadE/TadG family type IV pilus assembly protein [Litoreibacter halocynthiae]TDT75082.1 Flp pilus assembly protein TadG [Litoreibacter halocynthiae]